MFQERRDSSIHRTVYRFGQTGEQCRDRNRRLEGLQLTSGGVGATGGIGSNGTVLCGQGMTAA